jgi:hypothetical protein
MTRYQDNEDYEARNADFEKWRRRMERFEEISVSSVISNKENDVIELGRKVVVTTEYRGVFFGALTAYDINARTATLASCRNCVYWPSTNHGFVGLAIDGPLSGSRVGPAAESMDLVGITSMTPCADAAATRWESGPWA